MRKSQERDQKRRQAPHYNPPSLWIERGPRLCGRHRILFRGGQPIVVDVFVYTGGDVNAITGVKSKCSMVEIDAVKLQCPRSYSRSLMTESEGSVAAERVGR